MALKKFQDNTVGEAFEVNDNFAVALRQAGRNLGRQAIDRIVVQQDEEYVEAYTSSGGRHSTINTGETTNTFDTNKYKHNGTGITVHNIPYTRFPGTTSTIGIYPIIEDLDWEDGADIEANVRLDIGPFVIIEATSISAISDFAINNCVIYPYSSGKWILYCTFGTDEVRRAQIIKTLFYGSDGTDPRASSTYITSITALKTSVARDVGKQAHFAKADEGGNGVGTYTGTFANTTTNTDCSSWSYVSDVGSSSGQWELPSGTTLNNSANEIGIDTTADEADNPAACQIDINNVGSGGVVIRAIVLCVGDIIWVAAGTNKNASNTDFLTTNSIPVFTATTETLDEGESGFISIGKNGNIISISDMDAINKIDIKLIQKSVSPTAGKPSTKTLTVVR
jgi:hypothetical protein